MLWLNISDDAVATDTINGNGSATVPTGYYVIKDSYINNQMRHKKC